jgi:hypothetical protein
MTNSDNVPFMISIPKQCRDTLRKIAAEQNLSNPDEVTSAARLGREIILKHLESMNQEIGADLEGGK